MPRIHVHIHDSFEESKHPRQGGKFARSSSGALVHVTPASTQHFGDRVSGLGSVQSVHHVTLHGKRIGSVVKHSEEGDHVMQGRYSVAKTGGKTSHASIHGAPEAGKAHENILFKRGSSQQEAIDDLVKHHQSQSKAADSGAFKEAEHPRGKGGKFGLSKADTDSIVKMSPGAIKAQAAEKARRDAHHAKPLTLPDQPVWDQHDGVDVLRIPGAKHAAFPVNGRKDAATWQTYHTETREAGPQLKKHEVRGWLLAAHRASQE